MVGRDDGCTKFEIQGSRGERSHTKRIEPIENEKGSFNWVIFNWQLEVTPSA
jgi:hypothetical protein